MVRIVVVSLWLSLCRYNSVASNFGMKEIVLLLLLGGMMNLFLRKIILGSIHTVITAWLKTPQKCTTL